ncbi:hypothetical protein MJO29_004627 [Puccinia striiformis f. sp. tritici]|uniref:Uncharacterized protein n=1 Tax=Puccinia striiformis f. sp. tritici PST-78 TaxID=1165861 RepID=A0A0L0V284_9BASI|nr:hypothetical protein Pst134EB_008777 [Puccinia striiformis f. sp. tritici]KAI7964200.1 hypothetical protein MJO29_004627 [Puccinia striiformis f. sp. tritici]KAI9610974.1 hypothetical protein H4Q26_008821 [Puccinia striiformis f. sp. tritici PST-130]KNE93291.1 hypothetical protein PSTG_13331 [Puccinia striiformis f. sp. tritici PST-78]
MPAFRLSGSSPFDLVSPRKPTCGEKVKTEQILLKPSASAFQLPLVELDSEALLSMEQFSMTTLAHDLNTLARTSLEFSEEESFSDESISTQRTSSPDCTTLFHESYHYDERPVSFPPRSPAVLPQELQNPNGPASAAKRISAKEQSNLTKQPFAFLSEPYKAHESKPTKVNTLKGKRSQIFQRKVNSATKIELSHGSQVLSSHNGATKPKLDSQKTDDEFGPNHLDVTTSSSKGRGSYTTECQSHTMSSVFEDDSDDDDAPCLKKVLPAWIVNNKKAKTNSVPPPPKLVKQKSRIFKSNRSSLSATTP